jgi:hypothetical protein
MRSYMNLAVLALAATSVCPALSAPTESLSAPTEYRHRYGNLLVEFKGRRPDERNF